MAMIQCRECGKKISDAAVACPECGCPVQNQTDGTTASTPSAAVAADDTLKKNKRKQLLSIIGTVIALAVAIGTPLLNRCNKTLREEMIRENKNAAIQVLQDVKNEENFDNCAKYVVPDKRNDEELCFMVHILGIKMKAYPDQITFTDCKVKTDWVTITVSYPVEATSTTEKAIVEFVRKNGEWFISKMEVLD